MLELKVKNSPQGKTFNEDAVTDIIEIIMNKFNSGLTMSTQKTKALQKKG